MQVLHEFINLMSKMVQVVPSFALLDEDEPPSYDFVHSLLASRDIPPTLHHLDPPSCSGDSKKSNSKQWSLHHATSQLPLHNVSNSFHYDFQHPIYFGR